MIKVWFLLNLKIANGTKFGKTYYRGTGMEAVAGGKWDIYITYIYFVLPTSHVIAIIKMYATFLIRSGFFTNSSNNEVKTDSCTPAKAPYFTKV